MYKYAKEGNLSYDDFDVLQKERRVAFKQADINMRDHEATQKLFHLKDRSLQNIALSANFLNQEELEKNVDAVEKLAEEYNETFLSDYQLLDKEWQSLLSEAF